MRLELYQNEITQIAKEQSEVLQEVRQKLLAGTSLSRLETNGLLHAVQLLVESAIGKAKQILKAREEPVPISGYDAFMALARIQDITDSDLKEWNSVIGLRNRIVHEYMNIDIALVLELIRENKMEFVISFLLEPIGDG